MDETFKILIVEDEHIVALDLQQQVEKLGYAVVGIASSAQKAIDLAFETDPDLILMDIRLQGDKDGIEAAHEIRAKKPMPIVYLTAYADVKTLERASETRPLGYILKPFQLRDLEATIQLALYKFEVQIELDNYTRQLDSIMRYATDGFILVDSSANIIRANDKAESYLELFGHQPDAPLSHLGQHAIEDLLHGEKSEVLTVTIPESERVFEMTVSEEFVADSNPQQIDVAPTARLFVLRDITVQRRLQRENEVNARMAAIGQLAAGIAHDFNNILGIILTRTDLIKMTQPNLTNKSGEYLSSIRHHVHRATNLITQVLDFTRSSQLDMNALNVYPLLNELIKLVRRTVPTSIDIEFKHDASDYWINGDPTRISQSIMNLVLRAQSVMDRAGVLSISIGTVDQDALSESTTVVSSMSWVKICISDSGAPIAPEIASHLFDPVVAPEETDRGASMQLAQTGGIIEQHGGHIKVISDSHGTTFEIYLPELIIDTPDDPYDVDHIIQSQMSDEAVVLLVEDDDDLREGVSEILTAFGYTIITAVDGQDGLAKFQEHSASIDVVLTDMIMPNMNGLQMCREIRKQSKVVELIITSGYSSQKPEQDDEIGLLAWLEKPVDIEVLDQTLKRAAKS